RLVVFCAACALSVAELGMFPMPSSAVSVPPPVYSALEKQPPGILAEYPLDDPTTARNSLYIFWQRLHGQPLLNGAGAYTRAEAIRRMLVDPRSVETARALAFLGVRNIVTRPTTYVWHPGDTPRRVSLGAGYRLVAAYADGTKLWSVVAPPAAALAAYRVDDVRDPRSLAPDGFVGYPLAHSSVCLDIYARQSRSVTLSFQVRSASPVTIEAT